MVCIVCIKTLIYVFVGKCIVKKYFKKLKYLDKVCVGGEVSYLFGNYVFLFHGDNVLYSRNRTYYNEICLPFFVAEECTQKVFGIFI